MNKYFRTAFLMALLAMFVFSTSQSYAQPCKGMGKGQCSVKFVDANGDGKCENFVDANNDGKCDNCPAMGKCDGSGMGQGKCDGTGKGMGNCGKVGKCSKFVDANGDGICDNFVDANNDGKCDNCKSNGNCNGKGKCDGKNMGQDNCGKGMMGKGKCSRSCKMSGSVNANAQTSFSVDQNVPNPFNAMTKIPFNLKSENDVKVALYDNSGNLIRNVYDGRLQAGDHEVELNSEGINPGNYIYTITVGGKVQSKQLVVVK
jgi:hypothetical protein